MPHQPNSTTDPAHASPAQRTMHILPALQCCHRRTAPTRPPACSPHSLLGAGGGTGFYPGQGNGTSSCVTLNAIRDTGTEAGAVGNPNWSTQTFPNGDQLFAPTESVTSCSCVALASRDSVLWLTVTVSECCCVPEYDTLTVTGYDTLPNSQDTTHSN